jgi:hypothetical protein
LLILTKDKFLSFERTHQADILVFMTQATKNRDSDTGPVDIIASRVIRQSLDPAVLKAILDFKEVYTHLISTPVKEAKASRNRADGDRMRTMKNYQPEIDMSVRHLSPLNVKHYLKHLQPGPGTWISYGRFEREYLKIYRETLTEDISWEATVIPKDIPVPHIPLGVAPITRQNAIMFENLEASLELPLPTTGSAAVIRAQADSIPAAAVHAGAVPARVYVPNQRVQKLSPGFLFAKRLEQLLGCMAQHSGALLISSESGAEIRRTMKQYWPLTSVMPSKKPVSEDSDANLKLFGEFIVKVPKEESAHALTIKNLEAFDSWCAHVDKLGVGVHSFTNINHAQSTHCAVPNPHLKRNRSRADVLTSTLPNVLKQLPSERDSLEDELTSEYDDLTTVTSSLSCWKNILITVLRDENIDLPYCPYQDFHSNLKSIMSPSMEMFARFHKLNVKGVAIMYGTFQAHCYDPRTCHYILREWFGVSTGLASFVTTLILEELRGVNLEDYEDLGLNLNVPKNQMIFAGILGFNPGFMAFLKYQTVPISMLSSVRTILDPKVREKEEESVVTRCIEVGLHVDHDLALFLIQQFDEEKAAGE